VTRPKAVVDSSVWLEILIGGPLARQCQSILSAYQIQAVPTVVIFEVYRRIAKSLGEDRALPPVAFLKSHGVIDFTEELALLAADLSLEFRLAMADSIVLAHAVGLHAKLLTLDNDFVNIPGAIVVRSKS
jgi:toxin FitB